MARFQDVDYLNEERPVYGNGMPRERRFGKRRSRLVVADRVGAMLMEEVSKEKALKL